MNSSLRRIVLGLALLALSLAGARAASAHSGNATAGAPAAAAAGAPAPPGKPVDVTGTYVLRHVDDFKHGEYHHYVKAGADTYELALPDEHPFRPGTRIHVVGTLRSATTISVEKAAA